MLSVIFRILYSQYFPNNKQVAYGKLLFIWYALVSYCAFLQLHHLIKLYMLMKMGMRIGNNAIGSRCEWEQCCHGNGREWEWEWFHGNARKREQQNSLQHISTVHTTLIFFLNKVVPSIKVTHRIVRTVHRQQYQYNIFRHHSSVAYCLFPKVFPEIIFPRTPAHSLLVFCPFGCIFVHRDQWNQIYTFLS